MAESHAESFYRELLESVAAFFGDLRPHLTPELRDVVLCMDAETHILLKYVKTPASPIYQDALDVMMTLSEKLPRANRFRSMIGRLAGIRSQDGLEDRVKILTNLNQDLAFACVRVDDSHHGDF